MAAGPTSTSRLARLNGLEQRVDRQQPADDDPTLGELRDRLDPGAREIVDVWLRALEAGPDSPDRALTCCRTHALRRVWGWVRCTESPDVHGLREIERMDRSCS